MIQDNFFIAIGPPKTGTTWLYKNLVNHPEVSLPRDKEIRYFWSKEFLKNPNWIKNTFYFHWHYRSKKKFLLRVSIEHAKTLFTKGKINSKNLLWDLKYFFGSQDDNWYINLFNTEKLTGDITPLYCELSENSIKKIKKLTPNAKIIISLRDPIEREWSRAKMNLMKKNREINSEEFIHHFKAPQQHKANDYVNLVKRWKKFFPQENVFIFFFDELIENPNSLLDRVCNFLQIKNIGFSDAKKKVNSSNSVKIPKDLRDRLVELNLPYMKKMPSYFNDEFSPKWIKKYEYI